MFFLTPTLGQQSSQNKAPLPLPPTSAIRCPIIMRVFRLPAPKQIEQVKVTHKGF